MEFWNDQRTDVHSDTSRFMGRDHSGILLRAKIAELHQTKEELKQAKSDATKSWLDSKPLIDELEKLQSDFEIAENRSATSVIVISELESQLEDTKISINSKRNQELDVRRMIDEINDKLEVTRKEMDEVKIGTDEKRRERAELKQVLWIRKQTLHTLQLTHRALRLELESSNASAAEAIQQITRSEKDDTTVELPPEDFESITKAANEETFLHEWRVSAFTEQRFLAQETRDLAFKRFEELYYPNSIPKENKIEDEITRIESFVEQEKEDSGMVNAQANLITEEDQRSTQQLIDVSESSSGRQTFDMVKKLPIFTQVRKFVVQIINKNLERRRVKNLVPTGK